MLPAQEIRDHRASIVRGVRATPERREVEDGLCLPSVSGLVPAQFGRFHRVETDAGARFRRSRTRALGFGYARVVLNNEPDLKDFITIRELVDYEPR